MLLTYGTAATNLVKKSGQSRPLPDLKKRAGCRTCRSQNRNPLRIY